MKKIPNTKYIQKLNNKYLIKKRIKNKITYFGTYNNIYEAIIQRDQLIQKQWKTQENKTMNIHERILKNGEKRYDIRKTKNNKTEHYGTYLSLETAIQTRDELIQSNWNWEVLAYN